MTASVDERRPAAAPRSVSSGLRRIAGISASLVSTQAVTALLGLLFWAVAARQSSRPQVGTALAAVSLMMLIGSVGTLGLGTLLIDRLPRTEQGERRVLVRNSLLLAGLAGAFLTAVFAAVAEGVLHVDNLRSMAGSPAAAAGLVLGIGLTALVMVLDQAVLSIGTGALQLERNVLASSVKIVALLALGAAGATSGMAIFLAWTIGTATSLPLVAWRTRGGRALDTSGRLVDLGRMRGLGRHAASHHALNLALQAPLQLLPLIVTVALSTAANSAFNTALLVTGFVFAVPYAIAIGVFASARGEERAAIAHMRTTIPLAVAASVAAYVVLFPFAGLVLRLFGSGYADDGATTLRVLVLAGIPFVVKDHFIALRRLQGRTSQAVTVIACFTVVELAAALVGARTHGIDGLSVAWVSVLAAEALVLLPPLLLAVRHAARDTEPVTPPGGQVTDEPAPNDEPAPTSLSAGSVPPSRDLTGPTLAAMALGLLLVAVAGAQSRPDAAGQLQAVTYVLGLAVVLVPAAFRILLSGTSDRERIALAVAVPIALQLSRPLINPQHFAYHDEFLHANVLRQIGSSHHLFSLNSLLPVSAYYPGLEIVTDAVRQTTGLPVYATSVVVLLLVRVVFALTLVALVRAVSGSTRVACVASVVYVSNPQLLFFNSQFSYQTLALPLAVLTLYAFVSRVRGRRSSLLGAAALASATAATHHLTAVLLVASLLGWLVLELLLRAKGERRDALGLAVLGAVGAAAVVLVAANPGNPVVSYLWSIVTSSSNDVGALTRGQQTKSVFKDSAGTSSYLWEKALILAALALVTVGLVPALLRSREWLRRRVPLAVLLSLVACLFPIIPAGHLTRATAEVGDRSSGFVFFGVAFVFGWWLWRRTLRARTAAVLAAALGIVMLGNVVLGAGPVSEQLPGAYQISADARSVDSDNLAAAQWLHDNVKGDTRVYADRVSGLLAAGVGGMFTVRHISTDIDASRLILDPEFTAADVALIKQARISYVVVDQRDSNSLPHEDVYIESGEFGSPRTAPVPAAALHKFDTVRGVTKVYDNGSIAIYDVRRLRGA
ncbi:O-antigen/teichoic acid export membrane protein [Motilibacter peucedani]|uniref:O-antigen/teichoic acid export membrane protein n=1 Tax=Motilibacter peucedani TaxID=598650 RepID=A0A420XLW1_9ACTN|nr:DUF6541 family protein [Motilibacter peucedani]RKS71301.1 O-antigen/teichoic acid export membrane protein [Motilibacter peucedani]